jgi:peptidyl-prolyl cis-trans isomerase SurA
LAKKKQPQAVHPPTKRQLTHWQKQALRQRIIAITSIVTILAVIAVIVVPGYFKWYVPNVKPMHETVVEVNGHKFSMAYYVDALKYWEAVYEGMYSSGGQTFYQYITDSVEQNIEQNEIIKEASVKLGITVSDAEVNQYIKDNSLGNNLAVRDIVRGRLLSQKLTSDYFGPQVPTSGQQRDVLAMFLESQSQLDDIKAQINAGADFGQLATDNSLESTTQTDKGALGSHFKGVFDYLLNTTGLDDAIFAQQVGAWGDFHDANTAKQVGYWLVKVTERNSDNSQMHVSGMLLSSLEEAQSVKSQLDAGADFTTLAQQYSQKWSDTSKDDLGWITTSTTDAYKSYIFDTTIAVGTVSSPIKDTGQSTKGGYWLFKVLGSTSGNISADDKTDLTNKAFNDWLTALQADTVNNTIVNSLDQAKKDFATARAES